MTSPRPSASIQLSLGSWRLAIERTRISVAQLARDYDRAAAWWQRSVRWLGYERAYIELFQALTADGWLSGLGPAAPIIDCGIGTGALSEALVQTSAGAIGQFRSYLDARLYSGRPVSIVRSAHSSVDCRSRLFSLARRLC